MEGCRELVAIDGSPKKVSGRVAACDGAVVQRDYDKEEEPWYGIYGAMLAEMDVQRTITRVEPWAFTTALTGLTGPSTIHADGMCITGEGENHVLGQSKKQCGFMDVMLGVTGGVC